MIRTQRRRCRYTPSALEFMERRELLSTTAVLMTDGGLDSQPTWGIQPDAGDLSGSLNSVFNAESVITTYLLGNPIDFNKDGYPDLIELGQTTEQVSYGVSNISLVAADRGTFGKVAFGGPNGLVFSDKGFTTATKVLVQFQGDLATVVDLNGDGYSDLLTIHASNATPGSGVVAHGFLYNPAQQSFVASAPGSTINGWANKTGQMTLGDVDSDGVPDLVLPQFSTVSVTDPRGGGNPVLPLIGFQVFLGQNDPGTGRWTGDFATNPVSTVALRQPNAEWCIGLDQDGKMVSPFGYTSVINSALADISGDGKLDLVIPEADGLTVFPNPGTGAFAQGSGVFVQSAGAAAGLNLVVGDFNGDGHPDLASSPNYVSAWDKRDTSPTFSVWAASQAPLSVYLNITAPAGAPSLALRAVNAFETPGPGWNGSIALADFNGDGHLDIAVGSGSNHSTSYGIVSGDGTGAFGSLTLYQAYSNNADGYDDRFERAIDSLAVSDFNRDGQVDLVATAVNVGPVGATASFGFKENTAVGITGVSENKTFATPGVSPETVTAIVGQAFSQTLTPTGGDPSKSYVFGLDPRSVPLPPGMTLSPAGVLSGTPTQSGPFQLILAIVQPNGPRSLVRMNLNVDSPQGSYMLPGILPNAVAGLPFQQQLTATRGPATWTVINGVLVNGLVLSSQGLISGTPLATGTYNFTVQATGSGFQTVMNYQLLVQSVAAPVVTSVVRTALKNHATTLKVSFSQDMDPASANNIANHVLVVPGRDGRLGTADDKRIALGSAVYDSVTRVVTLSTARKNLPLPLFRLTVVGSPTTGLRNTTGVYLGDQGVGAPGTNYVQVFGKPVSIGAKHPKHHKKHSGC